MDEPLEEDLEELPGRILVVDDDELTLKNVRKVLTKVGYSVSTSNNPVRARELLLVADFDLVITDLQMPYLNGLDLLEDARREVPGLEVIIITGFPSIDGAVEATKQGAYHYLAKPFTRKELLSPVMRALRQEPEDLRRQQGCLRGARGHGHRRVGRVV